MSLENYSKPHPGEEYVSKEFIPIPRCNEGDTVTFIVNKDGKDYTSTPIVVGPNKMIKSQRLRLIIYDWEPEEVSP